MNAGFRPYIVGPEPWPPGGGETSVIQGLRRLSHQVWVEQGEDGSPTLRLDPHADPGTVARAQKHAQELLDLLNAEVAT